MQGKYYDYGQLVSQGEVVQQKESSDKDRGDSDHKM